MSDPRLKASAKRYRARLESLDNQRRRSVLISPQRAPQRARRGRWRQGETTHRRVTTPQNPPPKEPSTCRTKAARNEEPWGLLDVLETSSDSDPSETFEPMNVSNQEREEAVQEPGHDEEFIVISSDEECTDEDGDPEQGREEPQNTQTTTHVSAQYQQIGNVRHGYIELTPYTRTILSTSKTVIRSDFQPHPTNAPQISWPSSLEHPTEEMEIDGEAEQQQPVTIPTGTNGPTYVSLPDTFPHCLLVHHQPYPYHHSRNQPLVNRPSHPYPNHHNQPPYHRRSHQPPNSPPRHFPDIVTSVHPPATSSNVHSRTQTPGRERPPTPGTGDISDEYMDSWEQWALQDRISRFRTTDPSTWPRDLRVSLQGIQKVQKERVHFKRKKYTLMRTIMGQCFQLRVEENGHARAKIIEYHA